MLWAISLLIFTAGCVGGLVNSVVSGELKLPYRDTEARVYHPGWLGAVLVGGVAATVSWGLYGPLAELTLLGPGPPVIPRLRLAEFFGAVIIGFGGGRWLTAELNRILASRERDALDDAKHKLVDTLRKVTGQ